MILKLNAAELPMPRISTIRFAEYFIITESAGTLSLYASPRTTEKDKKSPMIPSPLKDMLYTPASGLRSIIVSNFTEPEPGCNRSTFSSFSVTCSYPGVPSSFIGPPDMFAYSIFVTMFAVPMGFDPASDS